MEPRGEPGLSGGQALSAGVCAAFICTGPWAPPPHPWSPAVPGPEQASREESGPASVARFSLRCPVRVSPVTLPASAGGAAAPGPPGPAGHTGAVEAAETSRPRLRCPPP